MVKFSILKSFGLFLIISFGVNSYCFAQKGFVLRKNTKAKKVDILYDGVLLTAYCYSDSLEKPVLFPLKTIHGTTVSRGWPADPHPGERTDHPHQMGLWFNYEQVNGIDFWNNSYVIPDSLKNNYGSIRHRKFLDLKHRLDKASLKTLSHWVDGKGTPMLSEETLFNFYITANTIIIDRIATLKAIVPEVVFTDIKDGLIGIRVARELEMPSSQKDRYVTADGGITSVLAINNEGVTGKYFNREGISGDSVWSSRSRWACLTGKKDGETISIAIIDHPQNPGYPSYWHARGYGLFAANPLGHKVFDSGKSELNFTLKKNEEAKFRFRIIIQSGKSLSPADIEDFSNSFSSFQE